MRAIDCTLGWRWAEGRLTIQTPTGTLNLTPLADDLIQFQVRAVGGALVLPTGGVVKHDWAPVQAAVTEQEGELVLTTPRMRVEITLEPVTLTWYEGDRVIARDEEIGVAPDRIVLRRHMPKDEHYYGFGQKIGFLDKRGRKMEMWTTDDPNHTPTTDPLYQAIPFFMSLRNGHAAGLWVDTVARSYFDMGSLDPAETYTVEVLSPLFDSYVFAGPSMKAIIGRYTELTGRMELPPLWSLGFQQCRWSYFPEEKIRDLAANFRERKIPCDVLWLDIDYMNGYRVFTWDRERFHNPAKLTADLGEQGFRVVTIVDPGVKVDPNYDVYLEGVANDHFIKNPDGTVHEGKVWPGTTAYPDFLKESTRKWWGDRHQEAYFDNGIAGIWNDMNEPSSFIHNAHGERTVPRDAMQGDDGRQVKHEDVHNSYGFRMCQATYEAMKRIRPEKRPFILTRSGASGIQRYAAVWMGDNHSWWEHLLYHMPVCVGMGLSGVPFVGCDVGGFSANPNGELVARWIQLGAFTPFFRMHTAMGTRDQEPWSFGADVEAICREYINLRYRLLPFFYTLFEEAHRTGQPIMRPLVLEHQEDTETYHISDEVLIGRDVLVAPIFQPGATQRMVYLPEGTWTDFFSGVQYEGRQYIIAQAPLDTLPLFIRAGAVLPMGPLMQHTGEVPMETLTLHVFPGADGEFTLYEDEGEGYGYCQGAFARTRIALQGSKLTVGTPEGGYKPTWTQVELLVHGEMATVQVDGQAVETTEAEAG
ncbi:MAG TPA: TIM-barrel domain-containing protein, partial [Symbiobacteriaceae bacterium]|nr:TIM-barrel domain-containing protein [Symbiobacteriaceae bacterium]